MITKTKQKARKKKEMSTYKERVRKNKNEKVHDNKKE